MYFNCITDCTEAKCLVTPTSCAETANLTIGTLEADTDYWIYVWNETTGKLILLPTTTDADGLLVLDMTVNPNFFNPNSQYAIWVTLPNVNETAKETITIGADTYTCFKVSFNDVFDSNNLAITPEEQTIAI